LFADLERIAKIQPGDLDHSSTRNVCAADRSSPSG
jgi:hypothetical protein